MGTGSDGASSNKKMQIALDNRLFSIKKSVDSVGLRFCNALDFELWSPVMEDTYCLGDG